MSILDRFFKNHFFYEICLGFLLLCVLCAHLFVSKTPPDAFVFDEAFYVPAARDFFSLKVSNVEHPPLAKAAIAASIKVFGDSGFGWRFPSIIFGTSAIAVLYFLVRRFSDKKTAFIASFLLSFESLWFIHSSIAMLDIVGISIALMALYLFFIREWVWCGAVLGVSMLAKEVTGIFLIVFVLFKIMMHPKPLTVASLTEAGKMFFYTTSASLVVFMGGMQIYDSIFYAFATSFDHVARMIHHNRAIMTAPISDATHPLQWFSGFLPSPYFVTTTTLNGGLKRNIVQYYGEPNHVVLLLIWLALPFCLFKIRFKNQLVLFHSLVFIISYAFFIYVAHSRITYPFYMLLAMPSLCVLVALFLTQFSRSVVLFYCVGVLSWFVFWFPKNVFLLHM